MWERNAETIQNQQMFTGILNDITHDLVSLKFKKYPLGGEGGKKAAV